MFKRKVKKNRDTFVRPALIFAGDIEHHIFPAVTPVSRQVIGDPFRSFGKQIELHIRPLPDNRPCFISPGISFFQKEIRGHAHTDHLTAFNLILPAAVFRQWIPKSCFCPVDLSPVLIPKRVQVIHITVLAAFTALSAAVPGIPYIVQGRSPPYFFKASLREWGIPLGPRTAKIPYSLFNLSQLNRAGEYRFLRRIFISAVIDTFLSEY
jgi:hypothetical protein